MIFRWKAIFCAKKKSMKHKKINLFVNKQSEKLSQEYKDSKWHSFSTGKISMLVAATYPSIQQSLHRGLQTDLMNDKNFFGEKKMWSKGRGKKIILFKYVIKAMQIFEYKQNFVCFIIILDRSPLAKIISTTFAIFISKLIFCIKKLISNLQL